MNIQIKRDEINCIVPGKIAYDQLEIQLNSQLAGTGIAFCRRDLGAQFLQWTLPGDGWERLSEATDSLQDRIQQVFENRRSAVVAAFGGNNTLAQAVLTMPSDEYLFFKQLPNGTIDIALVAWGYKFPHKPINERIKDHKPPSVERQNARLSFVYDGQCEPNMRFLLNGMERQTAADGFFDIGSHPIGTEFQIIYRDNNSYTLQVEKGRSLYEIDMTEYVTIEVTARKDGEPYARALCNLSYHGRSVTLTTDDHGMASVEWPYCRDEILCKAVIDGQTDSRKAVKPKTELFIEIETVESVAEEKNPVEEPQLPSEPVDGPKDPKKEPPVAEPKVVRIRLLGYKGAPLPELDFTVRTKLGVLEGKTDQDGYASFPAEMFNDGERPKIHFTLTKEYKRQHDIYAKPKKK